MAMTPFEYDEILRVCYWCGERDTDNMWWTGIDLCKLTLCLYCVDELDVVEIVDMPFVPIPIREWYLEGA